MSHTWRTIDRLINEYLIALISNKAVDAISLLFSRLYKTTIVFLAKKSPGSKDDDTINGFLPLSTILTKVKCFLLTIPAFFVQPHNSQ